jgi:CheY-like chemotaxis protein
MLERTGDFIVEVETKAIVAVNHARMFRPDLVFMDIKMPGPDGFALARDLRREPGLRHKPIIFFSGMEHMEEAVQKIWRTGPTEFLEKGVSNAVIEQTVRRILAERIALYRASKKAA